MGKKIFCLLYVFNLIYLKNELELKYIFLFKFDMFDNIFEQYLLIGIAVIILLGIKYYAMNKSYKNKLEQFIHPQHLVSDIRAKLDKIKDLDIRILLSQNLTNLKEDTSKIRNIALLITIMKEDNINLNPFHNRILTTLK